MISRENGSALKVLCDKLSSVNWRLVGGTNLALQGVDILAKDIDIQIAIADIKMVQNVLQPYCVKLIEYSETDKFASYFGQFDIGGVQIDVMAGMSVMVNGVQAPSDMLTKRPVMIKIDDMEIPCIDLSTEYNAYVAMGRYEKAELIKTAINKIKVSD